MTQHNAHIEAHWRHHRSGYDWYQRYKRDRNMHPNKRYPTEIDAFCQCAECVSKAVKEELRNAG